MNDVLFVVFPYVSLILAVTVGIYRYRANRFSYSSLSSQFLENRALFWGAVPWHYGIGIILLAHALALLFPGAWARLIGHPTRLYVLEVAGLALALASLLGLLVLTVRRLVHERVRAVSSWMDAVLLVVLLVQVALGGYVALFFRWGSDWYLHTAVPWLWSLAALNPRPEYVTVLPLAVRLHMLGGFVLLALLPFTRLVHLFSLPLGYLWRPYQLVVWYRRPGPGVAPAPPPVPTPQEAGTARAGGRTSAWS